MRQSRENEKANFFALGFADTVFRLRNDCLRQLGGIRARLIDVRALQMATDFGHDALNCRHGFCAIIRLVGRIDRSGGVRTLWQMTEKEADLLARHFPFAQLARHAMPDRIGAHLLIKTRFVSQQLPSMGDGFDWAACIGHVPRIQFHVALHPRQQRRRDRKNGAEFLVLAAARWIEIKPAIRLVELHAPQVEDGARTRKRVRRNDQISQHMARFRCIHQSREFYGSDRPSLGLARTAFFDGFEAEDVRCLAEFLPFHRAVQRGSSHRQNAINATRVSAFALQPSSKAALFVRCDVGNRASGPEFRPIHESIPLRSRTGKVLRVIVPISNQDVVDRDLVWPAFGGAVVLDDPVGKREARLLKICCAKADAARLAAASVIPGPAPRAIGMLSPGLLAEPVISNLARLRLGVDSSAHASTDCCLKYAPIWSPV
ncbi:MAG TPA: hypothetical protein VGT78_06160 [Rhizomicrobium sp.]|nr:hypothetical protein [Rhizomicrobium sp.]